MLSEATIHKYIISRHKICQRSVLLEDMSDKPYGFFTQVGSKCVSILREEFSIRLRQARQTLA